MSKWIYVLFFLLLFPSKGFPQREVKKSNTREVIVMQDDTLIRANILTGKADIKLVEQLEYFWYRAGIITSNRGGYSGKLLHGSYHEFANGKLICKGWFENGLKTGKWAYWYDNGNISEISTWGKGQRDGEFAQYDITGNIITMGNHKDGLLHGEVSIHQGDSLVIKKYRKGEEKIPRIRVERRPVKEPSDSTLISETEKFD